jgi:hypothetical protein
MRAFLDGGPFVFTSPERWNALGLGSTAVFAAPLVYNTKRSGAFELGGRRFVLRRVVVRRIRHASLKKPDQFLRSAFCDPRVTLG